MATKQTKTVKSAPSLKVAPTQEYIEGFHQYIINDGNIITLELNELSASVTVKVTNREGNNFTATAELVEE